MGATLSRTVAVNLHEDLLPATTFLETFSLSKNKKQNKQKQQKQHQQTLLNEVAYRGLVPRPLSHFCWTKVIQSRAKATNVRHCRWRWSVEIKRITSLAYYKK
jgi:hypothetical protein